MQADTSCKVWPSNVTSNGSGKNSSRNFRAYPETCTSPVDGIPCVSSDCTKGSGLIEMDRMIAMGMETCLIPIIVIVTFFGSPISQTVGVGIGIFIVAFQNSMVIFLYGPNSSKEFLDV